MGRDCLLAGTLRLVLPCLVRHGGCCWLPMFWATAFCSVAWLCPAAAHGGRSIPLEVMLPGRFGLHLRTCPSLAYHLSLFAAHAFTFTTGSHASVAGPVGSLHIANSFSCAWLCLALVRRLKCLRLKMQMVYSVCSSRARLAFGSVPLPRVATKRLRHSCPFRLITCLRQLE